MTKIFLLGTFHFKYSDIDFYTEDAQNQLEAINRNLVKYNPDAVTVESPVQAQNITNLAYEKFSLEDLKCFDESRSEPLGQVCAWGNTHTLTYNKKFLKNETYQIGFRLGKTLGLNKIHTIDDDTILNDITEEASERIRDTSVEHWKKMNDGDHKTLLESLRHCNSDEWSYHNHQLYIVNNAIGAGNSYAGANYAGQWYMRNLKIFANLQKLCENHKRIFSLYGCGHLYILRELINFCEDMELVDYRNYL